MTLIDYTISRKLIKLYETRRNLLSKKKFIHFFTRAYVATGDQKFARVVAEPFLRYRLPNILFKVGGLATREYQSRDGRTSFPLARPNPRKVARAKLYQKYPALRFFDKFLFDIFQLQKFGLETVLTNREFASLLKTLKGINFRRLYYLREVLKVDSSYAFNSVMILKRLGLDRQLASDVECFLRKLYFQENLMIRRINDVSEFRSVIYSLTHIIIAESYFYERCVAGHQWIVRALIKNIDQIRSRATLDILTEVALVLKLCGADKKYAKVYCEILKTLASSLNWKRLRYDSEWLLRREHTNSLLLMLFNRHQIWRPWPNLKKYLKQYEITKN